MKIVILVSKLTGGGAERVAALWATGFTERGHEVCMVMTSTLPQYVTYPIPDAVKLYSVGSNLRLPLLRSLKNQVERVLGYKRLKLRRILKDLKPDVIIGVLHPWALQAFEATKGMDIKIINTEHNSFERPCTNPMSGNEYQSKFLTNKKFTHVTVLTNADFQIIRSQLENVTVLPNPLAFVPEINVPQKQKVVLAVGRLDAWRSKGFDILIEAWGRICHLHSDWSLHIAGAGEVQSVQYLQDLALKNGISRKQIIFLGFTKDICDIYKYSSIFVLSSRSEGFGMALIEAMSQGCACIACDYKGRQSEIITEESQGIICPTEDVGALASAMRRMIEDNEYRGKCQQNAIMRSQYYSLDKTMERWNDILKKI